MSEGLLADVAGAILDGTAIDWTSAEAIANDTERDLLGQLRLLATIADYHRRRPILRAKSVRHLEPLKRWAKRRLPRWARNSLDTHDLVHDTVLRTLKSTEGFEPRHVGAFQAYLRQAVLNRLRDELRRKEQESDVADLTDREFEVAGSGFERYERALQALKPKDREAIIARIEAKRPLSLEEVIGREAVESYDRALHRVKPEDRDAIIMRVELGESYADLALVLKQPSPEAARDVAQRALIRLAEEMKRHGE